MLPLVLLVKLLPTLVTVGGSAWSRHRQKKVLKEAMKMKDGFATTEFWTMIGAVLANFLAAKGVTVEAGAIAAGLAGLYTICRTILKLKSGK